MDLDNDKIWVIVCLTAIAIVAMFYLPEPEIVVSNIVSGLLGVATGRVMMGIGKGNALSANNRFQSNPRGKLSIAPMN